MKKTILFLSLFVSAGAFSQCSDLFFSEYLEGASNNKALEIYNPTSSTIDLSDYVIYRFNNGSTAATDSLFTVGNLLAGDVFVIGNPSAVAQIIAASDTLHTMTFYNGDDALILKKISTGDTLDIIGVVGVDPGTNWPVGTGATSEFTLVRQIGIQQGQLDWTISSTEWDVFPQNMMDSLGAHTMTACAACATTTSSIAEMQCDSLVSPSGLYKWTSTGIYTDTILNVAGCDSIITIDLTIGSTMGSLSATACESFISPSGNYTWTSSNTYFDTIPNAAGCDSVITVYLVITSMDNSVMEVDYTLTSNQTTGTYQWINCQDNSIISGATSQDFTAMVSGNYAVIISDSGCVDTSACSTILIWNVFENDLSAAIVASPNPTNGEVRLQLVKLYNRVAVRIYSLSGQLIDSQIFNQTSEILTELKGDKGCYIITVELETGETVQLKLIKE